MRGSGRIWHLSASVASAWLLFGCVAVTRDQAAQPTLPDMSVAAVPADAQKRADIRLQLAAGYYERGQFAVALEETRLALEAKPDFADAYSVQALIYMETGAAGQAESSFRQALRLVPDNPDFLNNYGWFLCNNDRAGESIAYFESALKNKSYKSPSKALVNAGVCSLRLQNRPAAERYFSQAFQYEPGNLVVNVNLANLYFDSRDFERARFHIAPVVKGDMASADVLWLAIRVERKLGNQQAQSELAAQLRRRYPASPEYAAYQRGVFDE